MEYPRLKPMKLSRFFPVPGHIPFGITGIPGPDLTMNTVAEKTVVILVASGNPKHIAALNTTLKRIYLRLVLLEVTRCSEILPIAERVTLDEILIDAQSNCMENLDIIMSNVKLIQPHIVFSVFNKPHTTAVDSAQSTLKEAQK